MIGDTAQLAVNLTLGGNFSAGLSQASGSLSRFGTVSAKFGSALSTFGGRIKSLITSPLGLLGLAGGLYGVERAIQGVISSAMDYQSAMEQLATQTGASQAEVDSMSKAVLDLSKSLPQGPNDLAAGLYHIESAGIRGAKALEILKVAAQGAALGNANLEDVVNAVVTANQSGIKGMEDMSSAMGTLNAIVGSGNMRMQDLSQAMTSGVLSAGKAFGLSIQSVGAALASMADQSGNVVDSATKLRMAIFLLGSPTSKATTELKSIGLGQLDLANAMRSPGGLVSAIGLLRDHMMKAGLIDSTGNPTAAGTNLIARAFGGGRSSTGIIQLLGQFDLLQQKQDAVNKGATGFTDAVAKAAETAKWKFGQFQSTLQEVGIQIGNILLPLVTDTMTSLGDWIGKHETDITNFFKGVVSGIRAAADTIGNIVGAASSFWDSIPSELRDLLIKGLIADRTIKFLFGFSPVGGLVSALSGAVGKALGVQLASAGVGKLFVQPVFVTNPGFGLGGAGTAVEGAAGAEVAGAGGMSVLASTAAVAAVGALALGGAAIIGGIAHAAGYKEGPQDTGYHGFMSDSQFNTLNNTLANSGLVGANAREDRVGGTIQQPGFGGFDLEPALYTTAKAVNNLAGVMTKADWLKKLSDSWNKAGQTMKAKITEAIAGLSGPHAGAAAAFLGANLGSHGFGAGGYKQAQDVIAQLKEMKQSPEVVKAIHQLEAKLPRLKVDRDDLQKAEAEALSNDPKNRKLDVLNGIMRDLKAHGDKTTQAKVQDLITAVKRGIVNVTVPVTIKLSGYTIAKRLYSSKMTNPNLLGP